MKLTEHFSDSEFDAKSSDGHYPDEWRSSKLPQLAARAEWLRGLAGSYGLVDSVYRTPSHNAEVGGTTHSQHMTGEAADLFFPLIGIKELAARVLAQLDGAPRFGQIILYLDKGHVHVSLPTLGERNGEVRYSFTSDGTEATRVYPFLTQQSLSDLPAFSEKQTALGFTSPAGLPLSHSSGSSSASGSITGHAHE